MQRTVIRNARAILPAGMHKSSPTQDVVIEDGIIRAIGHDLGITEGEIVDASDRIVMAGLVDAHLHSWQTALRGTAFNWSLPEYLRQMHGAASMHFTPEDVYIATLVGALSQIAAGTTTIGDWFHNVLSPAHSDAAIAALQEAGIRAVFFNGTPPPRTDAHPPREAKRLLNGALRDAGGLLTLGMAVMGPLYAPVEIAEADLRLARDLGLVISMHHSTPRPETDAAWHQLIDDDWFGPRVNIVHANHIDDTLLARLVDQGVTFTITPEVELGDGHGVPITGRLRALGAAPSIGIDVESMIGGDMLVAARFALAHQRALDHTARARDPTAPAPPNARDALEWATLEGARALGLHDRTGTLEVGKAADLVLIDAGAIELWSTHDPLVAALHTTAANVDSVMIAGQWRKRGGQMLHHGFSDLRHRLTESGARIAEAAGFETCVAV